MSARTTNVKLQPDRFSRITCPAAHTFRRSLVQRGGKPDGRGFSFADCFLREDEGALMSGTGVNGIPPIAQPGTVPITEGAGGIYSLFFVNCITLFSTDFSFQNSF